MNLRKPAATRGSREERRSQFWVKGVRIGDTPFDEKALGIFQPDILVSAQYLATYRRKFHLDPERLLMLAILEDAIVCFQDNVAATCKRKQTLHRDAEQWILDTDHDHLFSFENVCEMLGYEPDYLRRGLLRWRDEALAGRHGKRHLGARAGHGGRSFRSAPGNSSDYLENTGTL